MHPLTLADTIQRFETARAILGHTAVLTPKQITAAIEASTHQWFGHPVRDLSLPLLATRLQSAWWDVMLERHDPSLPEPVRPVVSHQDWCQPGDVLVEHVTLTGNTALRLVVAGPRELKLVLARHVPIPAGDPQRTILVALADDWTTIPECHSGCNHGDSAVEGDDYGEGIDLVTEPPSGEHQTETVDRAAVWLRWSADSGMLPEWAGNSARQALWDWSARCHRPHWARPQQRSLTAVRESLAELAELDARLDHQPEAAGGPEWERRNQLVMRVARAATLLGWPVGAGYDSALPEYPGVIIVDLPTGQVSWHVPDVPRRMPEHPSGWDGHTREDKAERIGAYLAAPVAGLA